MRKQTTKDKLLHLLKKSEFLSMKEIMGHFSISEVAVRKQLNELVRRGLVLESIEKQALGRPIHLYGLSTKGHHTFPNQHSVLPKEILDDLAEAYGESAIETILETRKRREQNEIQALFESDSFKEKVENMIDFQTNRGYMIEMEEKTNGDIQIKNFNCPIYNLAKHYQLVCQNEHQMYLELFPESQVKSEACLTKNENYCCWTITRPKEEA